MLYFFTIILLLSFWHTLAHLAQFGTGEKNYFPIRKRDYDKKWVVRDTCLIPRSLPVFGVGGCNRHIVIRIFWKIIDYFLESLFKYREYYLEIYKQFVNALFILLIQWCTLTLYRK